MKNGQHRADVVGWLSAQYEAAKSKTAGYGDRPVSATDCVLFAHGQSDIVRDTALSSNFEFLENRSCLEFKSSILFSVSVLRKDG